MDSVRQLCALLLKCTESLEEKIKTSQLTLDPDVEKQKDSHCKEIINHMKQIKDHIKIIADHTNRFEALVDQKRRSVVDRDYIKKQVQTFDNVVRRERKSVRPKEATSVKMLECWESILDEQQQNGKTLFQVEKRGNLTKTRRVVSSTAETFLDRSVYRSHSFDSLLVEDNAIREAVEAVNHVSQEEVNESIRKSRESLLSVKHDLMVESKPRIVGVVYKKNVNGLVSNRD